MTDDDRIRITNLRGQGLGYRAISKKLGISISTVKSFCHRKRVGKGEQAKAVFNLLYKRTYCENCGKVIHQAPNRKRKRFCCDKCRNKWWNTHLELVNRKAYYHFKCPQCGKEFQLYGDRRRKFCSHECYVQNRFGKQA